MSAKRSAWKRAQSPDTLVGEHTSNREQVERYGLLAGDAGDQFFQRSGDEQLHHTRPLGHLTVYLEVLIRQSKTMRYLNF